MAEENITLISQEYATNELTSKGEFTTLEGRVEVAEGGIESLGKDAHNTTQRVSTLEDELDRVKNRVSTVESGKQDNLTPDNAGDNITITGEGSTLKINATGGSGEVKSDTWYCYCDNGELGFGFDHLKNDGILIHNWSGAYGLNQACGAKLVFSAEKSKAEVDYYLNAENTMAQDGTTITGYYKGCCLVCAICPWPANTPVPDTWYQNF